MGYSIRFSARHVNIFLNGRLIGYIRKDNGFCNTATDLAWTKDLRVVILLFGP